MSDSPCDGTLVYLRAWHAALCPAFFFSFCVWLVACVHLMDGEQTKRVRGVCGQIIQRVRCPRWVLQQQLLARPTCRNPKMAARLNEKASPCRTAHHSVATDTRADVRSSAIRTIIVPFHTRFPLFTGHLLWEWKQTWCGQLFSLQPFCCCLKDPIFLICSSV